MGAGSLRCGNRRLDQGQCPRVLNQIPADRIAEQVAEDREEFLDRVKGEIGFEVEVLTGDEEARRTLPGIRSGLLAGVTDLLALDIGGGSTEFILDRPGQSPVVRSINMGVVRLSKRILHHDPPTSDEIRQAR